MPSSRTRSSRERDRAQKEVTNADLSCSSGNQELKKEEEGNLDSEMSDAEMDESISNKSPAQSSPSCLDSTFPSPSNIIHTPIQRPKKKTDFSKRSGWWDHYTLVTSKDGTRSRKCRYCTTSYIDAGGTGNMAYHTRLSHPDKINTETDGLFIPPKTVSRARTSTAGRSLNKSSPNWDAQLNRRSGWWEHFTLETYEDGTHYRKCKYCPTIYTDTGGTGNMAYHIRTSHSEIVTEVKENTLFNESFDRPTAPKPRAFNTANNTATTFLMKFIVCNNFDFTMVDDELFQQFCYSLNPRFKLISGTTLEERIYMSYLENRFLVGAELAQENAGRASFTIDLTPYNNLTFMLIKCTWLTSDFEMKQVTLGFREIIGEQNCSNICSVFLDILEDYDLKERMLCVTTDNNSLNSTLIKDLVCKTATSSNPFLENYWIYCFSHVISLAVHESLEKIAHLISKIRYLASQIRSSPQRLQRFKDALRSSDLDPSLLEMDLTWESIQVETGQEPPVIKALVPILDVPTRWRSTLNLIKRAIAIRPGFDSVTECEEELHQFAISQIEWETVRQADEFLHPFLVVAEHEEGFLHPTLSCVMPLYLKLMGSLKMWAEDDSKCVEIRAAAFSNSERLKKYLDKCSEVSVIAIVLDPRLKLHFFQHMGLREEDGKDLIDSVVKPALFKIWEKYKNLNVTPSQVTSNGSSTLDPFISEIYEIKRRRDKDELMEYLEEESEQQNICVLTFWKEKRTKWPRLVLMARDFLATTATSASEEHKSSIGHDLLKIGSRTSVSVHSMQAYVCLKSWIESGIAKFKPLDNNDSKCSATVVDSLDSVDHPGAPV